MLREEVTVDKPMMTVDRQMGLVIITPEGKVSPSVLENNECLSKLSQDAVTIFNRIAYDPVRDQSVVRCKY